MRFIQCFILLALLSLPLVVSAASYYFQYESEAIAACEAKVSSSGYGYCSLWGKSSDGSGSWQRIVSYNSVDRFYFQTDVEPEPEPVDECAETYGNLFSKSEIGGECVIDPTACYWDFDTGTEVCQMPDDPNQPPEEDTDGENCVTNVETGAQFCTAEEEGEGCYSKDGEVFCPNNDRVCGEKNGTFECIEKTPDEGNCGYFNGAYQCIDAGGQPIAETSPDHPTNGGNADGDVNNDMTDPRTETEGGDPNNQPAPLPVPSDGSATEATLKQVASDTSKIAKNTADTAKLLDDMTGEVNPESETAKLQTGIEKSATDALTEMGLGEGEGGYLDGIGTETVDGLADGLGSRVNSLIGQGSCGDLMFWTSGMGPVALSCTGTQKIRDILSWVFYALTVWLLFDIVTTPVAKRD